ncbi:MAG TPA: phytanoyl-CoA dioxygenase family protein [Alphaproteobacteria bacterium]|nr:phytanoyl-CoA dioxygenase family protein [Alphaproteobacteria bacterium]
MPKVLSQEQIERFERDGFLPGIPVLTPEEVRYFRGRLESFERRYPEHVKKLKSKSHLLCPWVVELAEHPRILDVFEDLIGPNILCWSMAWRVKRPDGKTFAGWHQDSVYFRVDPILIFGPLALSDCGPEAGCLRVIPGSHKWGSLPHEDTEDPDSILARGQYITADFDKSKAVDLALRPGEMALINNTIVHCSGPNTSRDRRIMVLVEMVPTNARHDGFRDSAMLVRGVDTYHNFDEDPRPQEEFSPEAQAAWKRVIDVRAKLIFGNSRLAPSEAYGGVRPAT